MALVVWFYGAAVLAFSLFVVVMTTPRTRVEEKTVVEALKRGDLTARKAGKRTLISYADLEAYLASLPAYGAEA